MKKCMKIIFIILVIISLLNIATINVNADYSFSEIAGMIPAEIQKLTDAELKKYYEDIKTSREHVPQSQRGDLDKAYDKLEKELNRRAGLQEYQKYNPTLSGNSEKVTNIAGKVLKIVRNVGVVLAIIALGVIGIKYMVGSIEQRADYKKTMIPFTIGVIILATSTSLVSFIYDATTNALKEEEKVTFDETLQSGEDAAREFLSMPGLRKEQLYSQLASVSKKRSDAYYTAYFDVLIEAMPNNFEDGYNKGCTEIRDTYSQGLALKSCKENFDKATETSKKEYYAGYLLALGDTYGLIELAR